MNEETKSKKIIRGFLIGLAGSVLTGKINLTAFNKSTLASINSNSDRYFEESNDNFTNAEILQRDILIIAGNGEMAYGKREIEELYSNVALNKNIGNVALIGNGEEKINIKEIPERLDMMDKRRITIIIEMHGTIENNQFYFINGDEKISSKELFNLIFKNVGNNPVDIIVTSCNACDCLDDKDILPYGSLIRSFFAT